MKAANARPLAPETRTLEFHNLLILWNLLNKLDLRDRQLLPIFHAFADFIHFFSHRSTHRNNGGSELKWIQIGYTVFRVNSSDVHPLGSGSNWAESNMLLRLRCSIQIKVSKRNGCPRRRIDGSVCCCFFQLFELLAARSRIAGPLQFGTFLEC